MITPTPPIVDVLVAVVKVIKSLRWAERLIEHAESTTQHWDKEDPSGRGRLRRAAGQIGERTK
jgi:hypothetical protein